MLLQNLLEILKDALGSQYIQININLISFLSHAQLSRAWLFFCLKIFFKFCNIYSIRVDFQIRVCQSVDYTLTRFVERGITRHQYLLTMSIAKELEEILY